MKIGVLTFGCHGFVGLRRLPFGLPSTLTTIHTPATSVQIDGPPVPVLVDAARAASTGWRSNAPVALRA